MSLDHLYDFIARINTASTFQAVFVVLRQEMDRMGFETFSYQLMKAPEGLNRPFYLSGYKKDWTLHYIDRKYINDDIIGLISTRALSPFLWDDIKRRYRLTETQHLIFDEAAEIGLRIGGTVPIYGPDSAKALFSVASSQQGEAFRKLFWAHYLELQVIAIYAHRRLIRIGLDQSFSPIFLPDKKHIISDTRRNRSDILDIVRPVFIGSLDHPRPQRDLTTLPPHSATEAKGGIKRVFGLSLDESAIWAVAWSKDGLLASRPDFGELCTIPEDPSEKVSISKLIRDGLVRLHASRPDIFEGVEGIGVSTLGVVDREKRLLASADRKKWKVSHAENESDYLIDFEDIFLKTRGYNGGKIFKGNLSREDIVVQNDAPARCLAEYIYGFDEGPKPGSMFHIIAGEGINGAVIYGGDLPKTLRHPEVGHCLPQLHELDSNFNPRHSGCLKHHYCFEALASRARIRRQWGCELSDLSPDHEAWDIISFYLAQIVMMGVNMLDPDQITFGGAMVKGKKGKILIERIRDKVLRQNSGYLSHLDKDRVAKLIRRAAFGENVRIFAALTMANLAAYRGNMETERKTVAELRDHHIRLVTKNGKRV